eukprot:TRINITY_DN10691_c0_g1_i2.p1 TRINITY_DN10691_c0_g1~~TRINITY_DN10691_c0_g1_i2.p1  ORF type:complete len:624 (+),score=91.89 TRINITY_DN10691_c0_g1_i2:245-1873(+)
MPCEDPDNQVFYPTACQCVDIYNNISSGRYSPAEVCGPHFRFTWNPYGEGVCTCENGYLHDEESDACFLLGTQGPCEEGTIWSVKNGLPICEPVGNKLSIRVLDLIPQDVTKARIVKCYMDKKGRCRKTLGLNVNRFGETEFLEWINSFEHPKENCSINTCPGDKILWHDGQCYQAASTGPCNQDDEWIVLNGSIEHQPVMRCEKRKCEESEVWINCTCVSTIEKSRLNLDVCGDGEGWELTVSPYGSGICSCPHSLSGNDNKTCSLEDDTLELTRFDFINTRVSELLSSGSDEVATQKLATRQNCQVTGNFCQKVAISSNHSVEDDVKSVQDLIDWLNSFPSEGSTCLSDNARIKTSEDVMMRGSNGPKDQEECDQVGGGVYFKNGCHQLLSSTACTSSDQWLVLIEEETSLNLACKPKQCPQSDSFFLPNTCQCVEESSSSWCNNGDKMHDVFGNGICACPRNTVYSEQQQNCIEKEGEEKEESFDDQCLISQTELGSQGPCPEGYLLLLANSDSQPKCKKVDVPDVEISQQSIKNNKIS